MKVKLKPRVFTVWTLVCASHDSTRLVKIFDSEEKAEAWQEEWLAKNRNCSCGNVQSCWIVPKHVD